MASATVAKISNRESRPVRRRTVATSGVGAARRRTPSSRSARRLAPTSMASPLASEKVTPDRSMTIRLASGRSRPRSRSRSAGTDAMSSSALIATMV